MAVSALRNSTSGRIAMLRIQGNTDIAGGEHLPIGNHERRIELCQYPGSGFQRCLFRRVIIETRQDNRKFVATHARDGIAFANAVSNRRATPFSN
ncbi:MAG: hypothetical protein R3F38_07435 [Gammaproteobacteria bacterium]